MATAYLASYINVFETAKASRRGSVAAGDRLHTEETAGAQAQSRGQCYTEELLDIVQLLLTRELQLRELAEAAGQLLEDYEVAETQLEGKPEKAKSVFGHSRQLNTNFVSA